MERPLACVLGDLSLVRALGRAGIPVAVAGLPGDVTARSRFVRARVALPPLDEDEDGAVAALCAWASSLRPSPVLFYQGDQDLLLVSRARERLARFFRMVLPDAELVEDTVDKLRFARLAARVHLPTPRTLVIDEGAVPVDELSRWPDFPAVLKPGSRVGWFESRLSEEQARPGQKAFLVRDSDELMELVPLLEQHKGGAVLQRALFGGEQRVLSYHAYVRDDGELAAEFTGKKVRTSPRRFGISSCVEITDDDAVRALGRRVLERLALKGVVKLDFKRDERDERLYLLEVNPRFNLWHHPGAAAGVNIPAMVYRDLAEPWARLSSRRARAGVRWMAARRDLRAMREAKARGELGFGAWIGEWLRVDVDEDLTLMDPWPAALDVWAALKRRLALGDGDGMVS